MAHENLMVRVWHGLLEASEQWWRLGSPAFPEDRRRWATRSKVPISNQGEDMMDRNSKKIARVWRGVVEASAGDAYRDYVVETGVAGLRQTEGNQGVAILRRTEGSKEIIKVISLWPDKAAIERFAGSDLERAVYYPKDDEFLLEKTETVEHWDAEFWGIES